MTRKLVEAQEQERARSGRELHHDINQRLAMLAIELEQLKDNPSELGIRVQDLREQVTEISKDVEALSHDLHSSKLEYLGVVAGMKSWCKEFAERLGIEIDGRHDVESSLPREMGLCLFRVLQEALHNVAKHSGVKRIEVELSANSSQIHLTIRDLGKGFDVEAVKQGKGLGLTSMRERVRLVNGTIAIDSKPMGGTTISRLRSTCVAARFTKGGGLRSIISLAIFIVNIRPNALHRFVRRFGQRIPARMSRSCFLPTSFHSCSSRIAARLGYSSTFLI